MPTSKMRRFLIVCFLFTTLCATAGGPFNRTYKSAPVSTVLHDIEAYFSLQIMYRPQDIANVPAFSGTINTSNYQAALKQVLGSRLTFTVRNNVVVIKAAPPQPKTEPKSPPQSQSKPKPQAQANPQAQPKALPQKPASVQPKPKPQTPSSSQNMAETRGAESGTGKTDSTIFRSSQKEQNSESELPEKQESPILSFPLLNLQPLSLPTTPSISAVRLPKRMTVPRPTNRSPIPFSRRHVFQPVVSFGYGSELMTRLDLRYVFYFHDNWGVGGGLNFAYAAKPDAPAWREEGRIGLPIVLNTRWPLTRQWGIHATLGAIPSFPVYSGRSGTGISGREVDVIPFLEVSAQHPVSKHVDLLMGLYSQLSAVGVSPWSVGVCLGLEIGK
ncbi:MAG: hypothetical protein IKQ75_00450 [Bacteroidales bacterium]|nr:hypothetical protein [Bacteroidales bacterium]